jgi:predicted transcriptional regulator/ribosomal protein S18 acetylase RimI-like enzyme
MTTLSASSLVRTAGPEDFGPIKEFLLETSHLYPGIGLWWSRTVLPDLRSGRRVAVVLEDKSRLGGIFIGKPGRRAKLCTLRLREEWRDLGLGPLLMSEGIAKLVDDRTRQVYVTVSEAAEPGCTRFFERMGFSLIGAERNRYVRGVDEFVYSCPASELRARLRDISNRRATKTLFGLIPKPPSEAPQSRTLILSLLPRYADLMIQGMKTVEFRRRFSQRHAGATVLFYVSKPVQAFLLSARISHVDQDSTDSLWSTHKNGGGISKETFSNYFAGAGCGFALALDGVRPLSAPLTLQRVKMAWPEFHPPQAFSILEPGSPLTRMLATESAEGGNAHGHRDSFPPRSP